MDVGAWLRDLGLGRYEREFRDNAVDAEVLPELTGDDLKELGVTAVGHRRRLLAAIAALGAAGSDAATASAAPMPSATLLGAEAERRQVTVLFADLVGFTALGRELDAEEVHALLERFFGRVDRLVEAHGGRIDKHIGDCVMAVFGAPVAHGNDAERAVSAALAIRDAMPTLSAELGRPIGVHVGVAGGQVVASGTGSASHREYTVTGDTVNLASRLTDAAAPGEVLISEAVRRALAGCLDCDDGGALAAKGFAEPVRAWRVRGLRPELTAGRRAPLVGRHGELHQFRAALAACREAGRGQVIHLRGEAGIGKTRVVEEFQREAATAGFACHAGQALDFGVGTGRDPIRALVCGLLGLAPAADATAARAAAAAAVAEGRVPADDAVFLSDLLDLPPPGGLRTLYDAMDNAQRNRGKQRTAARLVERASRSRPRLLVVEDVHWADRPTLAHLAELAAAAAECPALLVLTSRIDGDPLDREWRSRTGGTPLLTVDLGPLRREEALRLAGAGFDAAGRFVEQCIERAGGNPLFLEQLLRHAEETAEAGVPGSVQNLVQARLDRLDPADKAALQAAAVLGQRFGRAVLGHVLDRADCALERPVAHLLVRPEGGEEFAFAHALIRDAVYDTLLRSRRRELHRRAADWYAERDPVLHAEHLDRAEHADAPRAYLRAASAQASAYHTDAALRLAERGLALAGDPADVFALTRLWGELLHDLGRIPDSIAAHRRALEAAATDAEWCRAWLGLASGMRVTDRYDEAFAALDAAEAAATRGGLVAELARVHHLRGNLCFPLGRLDECMREHERAVECARRAGSPELEARALGGLGDAHFARCRVATAYDYFDRCVGTARANGFVRVEVANLFMRASMHMYLNRLEDGLRDGVAAVELAGRLGDRRAEMVARRTVGGLILEGGDLDRAQAYHEEALARRLGARRFESPCLLHLGKIAVLRGDRPAARELVAEAAAVSRETGLTFMGPGVLGAAALAADSAEGRRAALDEGEAILRAGAVGLNYLWFYRDAMEACLAEQWWDEVDRYAAALEDHTRPEPLPWADFFVARGRALAAHGRGRRDGALEAVLGRLRDDAERVGFGLARPALEAALGGAAPGADGA